MNNKYKEILDLFKSDDGLREWMCEPFFYKDYAISTDANTMVFFDKSLCPELKEMPKEKTGSIDSVISCTNSMNFEITKDEYLKMIDAIPLIEEMESNKTKCDCCNGEGTVEYEFYYKCRTYEIDVDCPICDGEGETGIDKPTGKMVKDFSKRMLLKNSFLSTEFIARLFKVADILNEKVILISQDGATSKNVFKVGDVTVLIMPVMMNETSGIVYKII